MDLRARGIELVELKEVRPVTLRQFKLRLDRFLKFLAAKGIKTTEQFEDKNVMTLRHVLDYRASLKYEDSTTILEIRALRYLLRAFNREDLAKQLKTPKQTDAGMERRKPRPYTDAEIAAFRKVAKPQVELFFLASIQTGLSLCDLVLLKPENLRDGCVVTRRRKTRKDVMIPISPALLEKLRLVLPFWPGDNLYSGCAVWAEKLRLTAQKAGMWQRGSNVHRGRDSFVERQIAAGVPLAVVASRIGDRIDTLQKHYADLLSPLLRDANLSAPVVML